MEKIKMVLAECGIDGTCQCEECQEIYAELSAAKEALEKQTAKKIALKDGVLVEKSRTHCPACDKEVFELLDNYCPNCGQKLTFTED